MGGRRSLAKMLVTCFSTARSVTTSCPAIALFERPSAIRPSTSRSLAVSSASGSPARLRAEHLGHHLRGRARTRPRPRERDDSTKRSHVRDRVLRACSRPRRSGHRRRAGPRRRPPRRTATAPGRRSPGSSRLISLAARSPSSVCVGGILMSMIATSGLWARTFRSRSSAIAGLRDHRSTPSTGISAWARTPPRSSTEHRRRRDGISRPTVDPARSPTRRRPAAVSAAARFERPA